MCDVTCKYFFLFFRQKKQLRVMSGVLRSGVLRLMQNNKTVTTTKKTLLQNSLPCLQVACNVSGKALRSLQKVCKPKPYDYENKNYTYFNALFDKTTHRFDENSKVCIYIVELDNLWFK